MPRDRLARWPALFRAVSDQPVLALLSAGLAALILAAAVAAFSGLPYPRVHDEFSYLLAADTFARGRLTNPAPPFREHFDTMHVLQRPTYQSMYPPAQGLVLALGQRLGHPIVGVWLSAAAMAAAFCWMLRGWLPARWAWVGAMLAAAQVVFLGREYDHGAVGYWSQSYWGGAVAAAGGALVYGALPRLLRAGRRRDALLLGLGLAVLAHSRPVEGLVAALPAGAVLARAFWRRTIPVRTAWPLALVLVAAACTMGYYNHRVTGHALKMPIVEHHEQYCTFPVFLWQRPRPAPEWTHPVLAEFHGGWEMNLYTRHFPWPNLLRQTALKLARLWAFFLGPALTIPLLFMPWRGRWRIAGAACALVLAACLLCVRASPHYFAPAAAPLFLLLAAGLRRLHHIVLRGFPAGALLGLLVFIAAWVQALSALALPDRGNTSVSRFMSFRRDLERDLARAGGQHLLFVRYGPRHSIQNEWVYNGADMTTAPVLWARALDEESDRALRRHFQDRAAWRVEIDDDSARPELLPWPE
ncbi:MAG: hypothetical protein KA248_15385 [Kiritimatiellae bacterium]|nr:hypothetical protein [Kiritimatiellia bacterium]